MENKVSEQELRTKFPIFFEKIERVIFESRKYNLIDRFFHFYIENKEMSKYVRSLKLDMNVGLELINYIGILHSEEINIISKIRKCYEIESIDSYINSDKILFVNNLDLLGISPFFFKQEEWTQIIIEDIRRSNYKSTDLSELYVKIETCLNDTLERLGKKDFTDLTIFGKWKKNKPSDMFSLLEDDILELDDNSKSTENIMKDLMKWHSETQLNKIVLYGNFTTGKLIERIIEMFAKKSIKLSNENIEDIKSFISQNFKNSTGKNLGYKEIKNKSFFNEHLKFIKSILIDCIKKGNIKCTEKEIARRIHKSLPELGELKTIENY